jgi:membrane fusion protein (multidrug efflux system)
MNNATLISSLVTVLLMASCADKPEQTAQMAMEEKADTLKAFIIKSELLEKQVTLPGELLPLQRVELHAKVSGYVSKINVDIGSIVRKGQTLATIDAPEVKAQLSENYEKMLSAKANFNASSDVYKRLVIASKTPSAIAEGELEKAKNQMLADSARLQAATYATNAYRDVNNYLVIVAPFDGIVTKRNVDQGSMVGKSDLPLIELENNRKLRLRVAVPEVISSTSIKDNQITFQTRALPGRKFTGALARKSGRLDVNTRSELWEFVIENSNLDLKPGMFADVDLVISRKGASFSVPSSAVATTLERKFVIKVSGGKTQWIDVSQGMSFPDKIEIISNLQEGDTILLKGTDELKEGQKVVVKL